MKLVYSVVFVSLAASMSACSFEAKSTTRTTNDSPPSAPTESTTKESNSSTTTTVTTNSSKIPSQASVVARFREGMSPTILEDNNSTFILMQANVDEAVTVPAVNDLMKLSAASSKRFISPELGACKLTSFNFDFIGQGNQIFMADARDAKGETACRDFALAVAHEGLTMEFTNVPLLNDKRGVIQHLVVKIMPK